MMNIIRKKILLGPLLALSVAALLLTGFGPGFVGKAEAKKALEETNGDIAEAILKLTK